jgi:hypothetical protein
MAQDEEEEMHDAKNGTQERQTQQDAEGLAEAVDLEGQAMNLCRALNAVKAFHVWETRVVCAQQPKAGMFAKGSYTYQIHIENPHGGKVDANAIEFSTELHGPDFGRPVFKTGQVGTLLEDVNIFEIQLGRIKGGGELLPRLLADAGQPGFFDDDLKVGADAGQHSNWVMTGKTQNFLNMDGSPVNGLHTFTLKEETAAGYHWYRGKHHRLSIDFDDRTRDDSNPRL